MSSGSRRERRPPYEDPNREFERLNGELGEALQEAERLIDEVYKLDEAYRHRVRVVKVLVAVLSVTVCAGGGAGDSDDLDLAGNVRSDSGIKNWIMEQLKKVINV